MTEYSFTHEGLLREAQDNATRHSNTAGKRLEVIESLESQVARLRKALEEIALLQDHMFNGASAEHLVNLSTKYARAALKDSNDE